MSSTRRARAHSSVVLLALTTLPALAVCPPPPPPPTCEVDTELAGGRWDLSDLTGTYELSGTEIYYHYWHDNDFSTWEDYEPITGTLNVEMIGGPEESYLEVACDGTVTGEARERISGTIEKTERVDEGFVCEFSDPPADMSWNVTIERRYSITGDVVGNGTVDLTLDVVEATIEVDGNFAWGDDCFFSEETFDREPFDISGDTEEVQLSGAYDPMAGSWEPTFTSTGDRSWLEDIAYRFEIWGYNTQHYPEDSEGPMPALNPAGFTQPPYMYSNQFFLQEAVDVEQDVTMTAEPKTPVVTSLTLQEPSQYLSAVSVDTMVTAEIDWLGQPPGQVRFDYGGTSETVAGSDSVDWSFDAGEPGTTIVATAIGSEGDESQPYTVNTPKVAVPGWAEGPGSWSGSSGVEYQGDLSWPISLDTTQSISSTPLFSGQYGISGSASSTFEARASSNGSPGSGSLTTTASFEAAGRSASLQLNGTNQTTLACDELTTTGSASVSASPVSWKKTVNPLTLIPGLQSGACAISGFLCSALDSVGVKGSGNATLTGTGTFTGEGSQIQWDGGSVSGTISGRVGASASLPPPLASAAGVSIWGGATGCLEIQVAPDFQLTTVGGTLEAGARACLLGACASADHSWPFGSGCGRLGVGDATVAESGDLAGVGAFVPADGQLAMTARRDPGPGALVGAAVYSELPVGQVRPSGDIHLRTFRDDAWEDVVVLTDDIESDLAPTVAFTPSGNLLIVHQRSTAPLPTGVADLPAFADSYELHHELVDPESGAVLASGAVTSNGSHDLGPRLIEDGSGDLHLFWQRVSGVELAGTEDDPIVILVASWNDASQSFEPEETVADDLSFTWGWSAAAASDGEMLVALVEDTDEDLATADDREIVAVQKAGGVWLAPMPLTSNATVDDAPQVVFEGNDEPVVLWRSGEEVLELRGDLITSPVTAFSSPDPALDEGVGQRFAHGSVASAPEGLVTLWPDGLELLTTRDLVSAPGWETPKARFGTGAIEAVHDLRITGSALVVGWSLRDVQGDGVTPEDLVEPRFAVLPLVEDVFRDGFETGDTSSWNP